MINHTEDELCEELVKQTDEFQSQIRILSKKSDLCLDEIAKTLLPDNDPQALLGYLPYVNDETVSLLKALLKRADSLLEALCTDSTYENSKSKRLFREYKMWFDFIVRMTDAQEEELRKELPKINGFPADKLDKFIQKLRREWAGIFTLPEPWAVSFPKKESKRNRDSRISLLKDSWQKLNEYERGAIVTYIMREAGFDVIDTNKFLSHIGPALDSVKGWFETHKDQIDTIASNRDYWVLDILARLYRQYFPKKPSHNSTGPFARLVEIVLETNGLPLDSDNPICGIQNYLRSDRKSRKVTAQRRLHPGFEYIYIE